MELISIEFKNEQQKENWIRLFGSHKIDGLGVVEANILIEKFKDWEKRMSEGKVDLNTLKKNDIVYVNYMSEAMSVRVICNGFKKSLGKWEFKEVKENGEVLYYTTEALYAQSYTYLPRYNKIKGGL